jgi:hypothetical protein
MNGCSPGDICDKRWNLGWPVLDIARSCGISVAEVKAVIASHCPTPAAAPVAANRALASRATARKKTEPRKTVAEGCSTCDICDKRWNEGWPVRKIAEFCGMTVKEVNGYIASHCLTPQAAPKKAAPKKAAPKKAAPKKAAPKKAAPKKAAPKKAAARKR